MKKMLKSVRFRLLSGFLLIVAVILITSGFSVLAVGDAAGHLDAVGKSLAGTAQYSQVAELQTDLTAINRAQLTAMSLSSLLAMVVGFLLCRSIVLPLRSAIRVIEKLGQGDNSERLPMGTPVNCSAIKQCGKEDCPSFGKVDPCWVTSGSFAVIKHCPKAKKGIDCRECELYGAHNELDELGAILAGLSDNLEQREQLALQIANGDLTQEVPLASEKDSLGKALKIMTENLRGIIGQVQVAGEQIASGSGQVSESSQSLSQGATEQASSLEEISASLNEMSSQTSLNAENANQANQLTTEAQNAAQKGSNQMQAMVSAMAEINEAGQHISKIIKTIDEIAFQTNLLALNAAVEAARAGQHGKGFAVVAEEVRNLAARSAKAAAETAELIEGSVKKTTNGSVIANQTAEALQGIVTGVTKVSDLVSEIATASNEQAQGIAQINQGVTQIDSVTQQNTASAEECAAAAEELSSQAEQMRQMLQHFTLRQGQQIQAMTSHAPSRVLSNVGWTQIEREQQNAPAAKSLISLDDSDFGKY